LEVEYDFQIGIGLEVHDMEIQYWETFTLAELLPQLELPNHYAVLQRRLLERSLFRVLPEGVPAGSGNTETICDRKGRFGGIGFTPANMMRTAVSGSEEMFRITYNKWFCEFDFTGKCTMGTLTMIFKTLVRIGQPRRIQCCRTTNADELGARTRSVARRSRNCTSSTPLGPDQVNVLLLLLPQRAIEKGDRVRLSRRAAICNAS
jgi:hypothetical protein